MRWNGFSRTLLFALLAAAGVVPWLLVARPILGSGAALAIYLVGAVAAYLGGLAPELRRRLTAFVVAAAAGLVVAILARSFGELAIGLAVILAVGRSSVFHRPPALRSVVVEALVAGGGLLFARFFAGNSAASLVLAIWAFFLAQSLFFLIGGVRLRSATTARRDPFEEAHARAIGLLEGHGT